MKSWLSNCWGGSQATEFQRALMASTHPDWAIPLQEDYKCKIVNDLVIIATLKGQNTEMNKEKAFKKLIQNFQKQNENNSPAFALKNILIFDLLIEERILLFQICQCQKIKLLEFQNQDFEINKPINILINNYCSFIRQKALIYREQSLQLADSNKRSQYISTLSLNQMKNQINSCFKIQKLILIANKKYGNGNRDPQLIQGVFSSMLKSYLFCYSIVSMAISSLLGKVREMNKQQFQIFYEIVQNFNFYIKEFLFFLEKNKQISSFKTIRYNQFTSIDDKILKALHIQILKNSAPENGLIQKVLDIPIQVSNLNFQIQLDDQPFFLQRRKQLKLKKTQSFIDSDVFFNYENSYHQSFAPQFEENQIKSANPQSRRFFRLKHKLTLYQNVESANLRSNIQGLFNKEIWEEWEDIFAY